MKTINSILITCGLLTIIFSCQQQSTSLTDQQKKQITDSAIQVVKQVLEFSNKLDFNAAVNLYSADADARFVENGSIFPSLEAIKNAYEQLATALDYLENKAGSFDAIVLSNDAASITVPIHLKIKAKGLPEYSGQYVWSGIIQKRNGKWAIVQSHESWLNYAEAMAALTPKEENEKTTKP